MRRKQENLAPFGETCCMKKTSPFLGWLLKISNYRVFSPRILVVVNDGGVGVHVAAPKEAPAASSPKADTRPVTPALQTASTLRVIAQFEAARDTFAAKFPTQAPRMAPFTWQANSDSPSRGAGQVRMMALTSSPMPTAETKASTRTNILVPPRQYHRTSFNIVFLPQKKSKQKRATNSL